MTAPDVLCPQCQTPINPGGRYCSGCGVDLAVVTLLLEHSVTSASPERAEPAVPEFLVPRLGEFLMSQDLITEAQLRQALGRQRQIADGGGSAKLGEILVEMGLISREQLNQAIVAQVVDLQAALLLSNRHLEERVAARTAELEQALKLLNEANQLKTNFIAGISHELRTPLTQFKGYAGILVDGTLGEITPLQAEALQAGLRAAERLEKLIEDLIHFATAVRGELSIDPTTFSISELARSTLERTAFKADRANVRLADDIPARDLLVHGDLEKVSWVLFQLLDNAIKFTPPGGSVTLTVAPEAARPRATIAVRDTGIGVPADRIPELFQPFHQLDGSNTRRYGGTGLGLALVQRIVEAHQSQIVVESVVGQGSTFMFELPLG